MQWTARAKGFIDGDEYRFISPVFRYNPKTGEITELLHVALVNTPALDGMAQVAASYEILETKNGGIPVNSELLKMLGLPEDADDAAVLAAVQALIKKGASEAALKVDSNVSADAHSNDLELMGIIKELQGEIATLKADNEHNAVAALIAENKAKLPTPKLREWAHKQPLAVLKTFLEDMPEIAALKGGLQTTGGAPESKTTEEQWKAEFEGNAALKSEFGSVEMYQTYKRAVADGNMGE